MKRRKTLQELTIKDNFMFGAVMCNEQNCKRFLEIALGFPIEKWRSVTSIKRSREMESRYMIFKEMVKACGKSRDAGTVC